MKYTQALVLNYTNQYEYPEYLHTMRKAMQAFIFNTIYCFIYLLILVHLFIYILFIHILIAIIKFELDLLLMRV